MFAIAAIGALLYFNGELVPMHRRGKSANNLEETQSEAGATARGKIGTNARMLQQDAMSTATFSCDGRTLCREMTSCAEATYFLRNCPNVQMDGDGDGVPCERQWCTQ